MTRRVARFRDNSNRFLAGHLNFTLAWQRKDQAGGKRSVSLKLLAATAPLFETYNAP